MTNLLFTIPSAIKSINSVKKAYRNDFKTSPRPIMLCLETTYACTCKCVFCDRYKEGARRKKEELSLEEIKDLINQSYKLGVRIIYLSGGEPLLKKGILDVMEYSKNKGIINAVVTNGTLIDEKNVKRILEVFDFVTVSLDSLNQEKHDKIRGVKGTFKKTMKALKLLKKYSKNTIINVQSVLTPENMKDVKKVNQYFHKKGISTCFQPVHHDESNSFNVSNEKYKIFDMKSLQGFWKKFITEYKYPNNSYKYIFDEFHDKSIEFLKNPKSTIKDYECYAGSIDLYVNPYGEVFPCNMHRVSMGNIKNNELENLWNAKSNKKLRRTIKNRTCNCWMMCTALIYGRITGNYLRNIPALLFSSKR